MRVPPSTPDNLVRDGQVVRVWRHSWAKLKELARIRQMKRAECFDAIVTETLQAVWDRMEEEGKTIHPLELPPRKAQP